MPLNRKVALIVLAVFVVSCGASLLVQRSLILPSFVTLERETAERIVARVLEPIERQLALL